MSQQVEFVLDWLKTRQPKSVVYVGWRPETDVGPLRWCTTTGASLLIVEAFVRNADAAKGLGFDVAHSSIEAMVKNGSLWHADALLWLHGPEHVSRDRMWYTLGGIVHRIPHVLIQAPIGEDQQGPIDNNPYEIHIQTLYPRDFEQMDWSTAEHTDSGENTFSAWVGR